jgi:hypothetical protein
MSRCHGATLAARVYVAVVDGSSYAPNPDRESSERGGKSSRESDADRELSDLRARAYGPDPDIEADPAALARLIDLEAAHVAAPAAVAGTGYGVAAATDASRIVPTTDARIAMGRATPAAGPMSGRRAATSSTRYAPSVWERAADPRNRAWFITGSIVVVVIVVFSLIWLFGPRADATLHMTERETSGELLHVLGNRGWSADVSTLHQFEPFHDVEVWSLETGSGYVCLVAWDRGSGRFETQCVPPRTELAMYVEVTAEATAGFGERLPDGSVVSLHLREDTVDVYVDSPHADD